jgi:CubicO group peptidase (beta-lactamase class C family)
LSAHGQADAAPWTEVERLCEKFVADRRAPAISLAVSQHGALVFAKAWGQSNLEQGASVAPQTLFRIASVTKTFIGALFLKLARAAKLSLDDPASRWLPAFPRSSEFTLRMMLNHTSGLGEYTDRSFDDLARDAQRAYSNDEIVAYMSAINPLFVNKPGAGWKYSNTAYVLLGVIAELAGGAPIATLINGQLSTPAGLTETGWDIDPDRAQGRATGYGFRNSRWVQAPVVTTSYVGASGGIRSTARDLCKWFDALFDGQLLTREELAVMIMPATLADGRSTITSEGSGYGLGVWTGKADRRRVWWHAGTTAGFSADARHYPDHQLSIVMLGNADAGRMGSEPRRIREAVLKRIVSK